MPRAGQVHDGHDLVPQPGRHALGARLAEIVEFVGFLVPAGAMSISARIKRCDFAGLSNGGRRLGVAVFEHLAHAGGRG